MKTLEVKNAGAGDIGQRGTGMKAQKTIQIHNVGPIHDLEINMPEPGVYALIGDHGAGKSTALAAVARALGDDEIHVALRDGATKGSVVLDDVTLLAVGKIDRRTGKPSISLASTSPLATLVEPGIKDPIAAERARIQALLKLVDLPVTDEAIATLVQNNTEAMDYLDEHEGLDSLRDRDIVAATDKVRRLIHEMKRQYEDAAQQAQGEMIASQPEKPAVLVEIGISDAQQDYDKALRTLERLEGECSQRTARERERAEIQATLGERPDVRAAEAVADGARLKCETAQAEIQKLKQRLAAAQERWNGLDAERKRANDAAIEADHAAERWDRRKAILDSDLSGATAEDVERAQRAVAEAKASLEQARESAAYRERVAKYQEASHRSGEASRKATDAERLALNVTGQLGKLLAQSGIENATVEDGALMYIHDDGTLEPFARLSFGEKLSFGLGPFTQKNADRILALPFNFWLALNEAKQQEAVSLIVERGIRVITEVPGAGELRVQKVEAK